MDFILYTPTEFSNCMDLFTGNLDKYFAEGERAQYEDFLSNEALGGHYYVVKQGDLTVAAGGYFNHEGAYWMDWGMVCRSQHKKGIGSQLLNFRIQKIHEIDANARIKLCTSQYTKAFYQKFGFEVLRFTMHGFGENLHKYEMEKVR